MKSSGSWSGSGKSVILNTAGSPGAGEFSLKADDTVVLGSAVIVNINYITIGTGTQTAESGYTASANTLWQKLGASGIPAVTYSGASFFEISQ